MNWAKDIRVWLFAATFLTVSFAGSSIFGLMDFSRPLGIFYGTPFAFSLLVILLAHEMGHYAASRRWGIEVEGPYFIPFPFFLGTFGAVIKVKSVVPNRKALCDLGASGPWAGLIATLAILFLVYQLRTELPSFLVNQVKLAVLVGFLVTLINLLPVGSLDGGHLIYALLGCFGRNRVGYIMLLSFLFTMAYVIFFHSAISPVTFAILFFIGGGMRHYPTESDFLPLDWKRKIVAIATLVLYVVLLYGSTRVKFG